MLKHRVGGRSRHRQEGATGRTTRSPVSAGDACDGGGGDGSGVGVGKTAHELDGEGTCQAEFLTLLLSARMKIGRGTTPHFVAPLVGRSLSLVP
jgi:hypothetical protein